jgi:hypothetical protein
MLLLRAEGCWGGACATHASAPFKALAGRDVRRSGSAHRRGQVARERQPDLRPQLFDARKHPAKAAGVGGLGGGSASGTARARHGLPVDSTPKP